MELELELELEGEDGSKMELELGRGSSKAVFGRDSLGYKTEDRTVSRQHLLFQLDEREDPKVSFLVIGKNPVWVRSGETGMEIKLFRRFDKGEVSVGDCFCVSSQIPVWFRLKRVAVGGLCDDDDVSGSDPVKEFGFLVIGHEFDGYRKGRIKKAKDWDWFLEGSGGVSENEEETGENFVRGEKKCGRRLGKRKKSGGVGDDNDDEDWTGEGEEDMEIEPKNRKVDRGKEYATRSKDRLKVGKERKGKGGSGKRKDVGYNEEEAEDEDDETLGGFVVDEDEEEEEQAEEEDEEEEEFVDDDEEEK